MNTLDNDFGRLGAPARAYIEREHGLLIDGKSRATASRYDIIDPTSGQPFATAAEANEGDVADAVAAARCALTGPWARMRPNERQNCLLRMAALLDQNGAEISEIAAVESGRLLGNTRGIDVDYSNHFLTYMAGWAVSPSASRSVSSRRSCHGTSPWASPSGRSHQPSQRDAPLC